MRAFLFALRRACRLLLSSGADDAVGRCLDVLVKGDGADGVRFDKSRCGVLDVRDASADVRFQRGIFKGAVAGRVEGAVFQYQVVCVAEGLLAGDVAVDEAQVAGMPTEVLAVQLGVVDGDVLHFPERVFGRDFGVVDFHVLHVLEHVLAVAFQPVHVDVVAEHERIGTVMQFQVLDADMVASPEHFVGVVHLHVFYVYLVHLAEHLGGVDDGVFHFQMVGIPQGRAASHVEITAFDGEAVNVPKRVVPFKAAVRGHDVAAFLDGGFPGPDGHVVQMEVV